MIVGAVFYELGCPSKRETLVNYSGQRALSVTPSVVQASGRLASTTWSTNNFIFVLLLDFGVIFKVDRLG